MADPKKKVEITDGVDFICPFCSGVCTASLEQACVLHTEPTCEKFDELGPVEFLHAVNQRTHD